jgi:hypothetical protein
MLSSVILPNPPTTTLHSKIIPFLIKCCIEIFTMFTVLYSVQYMTTCTNVHCTWGKRITCGMTPCLLSTVKQCPFSRVMLGTWAQGSNLQQLTYIGVSL